MRKSMNPTTVNALIWAAMMVAVGLLTVELSSNEQFTILMLQIAGWFTIDTVIRKDKKAQDA